MSRRIGRYPVHGPSLRDPRLHVALVLLSIQTLGQTVLGFRVSIAAILACLATGAVIEFVVALLKDRVILWPASGLLTGNSAALILRVPGAVHGDWWSLRGIWIFIGVVAVSMASKYLIRRRGRHIFNPSNLGLVVAFVALGPRYTEPLDLWWAPVGPGLLAAYALLVVGGLLIGREVGLLGLQLGFLVGFAVFAATALLPAPDHCMVASWRVAPICGWSLWEVLVTSPEILVFGLFMVPDPRTVPEGPLARVAFGLLVALLAVLLLGPTSLEFWTKTAILGSLVIACAARFALARLAAPLEVLDGVGATLGRVGWRLPVAAAVLLLLLEALPVSADLAAFGTDPAAGRLDAAPQASVPLQVGTGVGLAGALMPAAAAALPTSTATAPPPATAYLFMVPELPPVSIDTKVAAFDPAITPAVAAQMARDVVLDLMIESEARRTHDPKLAASGAFGDGLKEFEDVINQDTSAGISVEKTYSFDRIGLSLYLPKFSTQAPRLTGVNLHGSTTITVRDAAGKLVSRTTSSYAKSWGLGGVDRSDGHRLIVNDFTDLAAA